jgi:hypothetical protein
MIDIVAMLRCQTPNELQCQKYIEGSLSGSANMHFVAKKGNAKDTGAVDLFISGKPSKSHRYYVDLVPQPDKFFG